MDKEKVITILGEMAALLELDGANNFKVRAYENALRAIEGINEDLSLLVESRRLTEISGIGKNIAAHISDIAKEWNI